MRVSFGRVEWDLKNHEIKTAPVRANFMQLTLIGGLRMLILLRGIDKRSV